MKRFELALTFLQVPFDFLLLLLAGLTAFSLRLTSFVIYYFPIKFDLSFDEFFGQLFFVSIGWMIIFILSGLYRINPNRKLTRDFGKIIMASSAGFGAIAIYLFFSLQKFDSRFLVLIGSLLAIIYLILGRFIIRQARRLFYRQGIGLRKTIIIGEEKIADIIKNTLIKQPQLGFSVVGTYASFSQKTKENLEKKLPDEIIFTNPKANEDETLSAVDFCNEHHVTFKYSADLFATISTNMAVSTIAEIPIIELRRTRLSGWGRIFKRLVDLIVSSLALIILAPIYITASIIILLETGRPIIYRNERVGQYGKNFFTLKFRSMYQKSSTGIQFGQSGEKALKEEEELIKTNSIKNGPVYKIKNDPRVTPFGRFIRRWSIDELPQFINVLRGEMSLVGPRPHQPREVNNYEKRHRIVFNIKPGMTGLAQISGRSDLSFEDEVRLDTFYIENWSLIIDIIILLKTPLAVFGKKGAI